MRPWLILAIATLPAIAAAQELPMSRDGLDGALAQYFAGADHDANGKLDCAEAAEALGVARSVLSAKRDEEPFVMDVAPDGRPRLMFNDKGPLGQGGLIDLFYRRTDRDGDGTLSLAEVQAAARERFDAVDQDRDGLLDETERHAAMGQLRMLRGMLGK